MRHLRPLVLLLALASEGQAKDCTGEPPAPSGCQSTSDCCAGPESAGMSCSLSCIDGACVASGNES